MDSISPALFYLLVAVALIGTELLIMQFSAFWFLFFGLGALITALVCWVVPDLSWIVATALFLGSSIVVSLAMYPMLKKWQDKPAPIAGNDAIGQKVTVLEAISAEDNGKVSWSGSDWPAQLDDDEAGLEKGDKAVIRRLEGIRLIVGR